MTATTNPLWNNLAARAGVPLSAEQHDRLSRFLDLLAEANATMNLTRIVDRPTAEVQHVGDALTVLPYPPPAGPFGRSAAASRSSTRSTCLGPNTTSLSRSPRPPGRTPATRGRPPGLRVNPFNSTHLPLSTRRFSRRLSCGTRLLFP